MSGPPLASSGAKKQKKSAEARKGSAFEIQSGKVSGAQRILIYGPGGAGKTSLAATMGEIGRKPIFLDLDDGSRHHDVDRIGRADLMTWENLLAVIRSPDLKGYDTIVIDSITAAEDLAVSHVLNTIPISARDGGGKADSLESYNWGRGYTYVFEAMLGLLMTLEQEHTTQGRSVVLIAHDCTAPVPNPKGEDYSRYEPRLQNSAKASIRLRTKEWVDHLFRIDFDVAVNRGKAGGAGTRSIYTTELPTFWAKTRDRELGKAGRLDYADGSPELWDRLFNTENK